jgi:3-oxoacyl-[acyl-carrier protein] reductase
VTGGSRGIGKGISARLVAEGAHVAILDVDEVRAKATAEELGGVVTAVPVDLAEPEQVAPAVTRAIGWLGGLDVLVNNAGIFQHVPLLEITVEQWDRMLAINARAVLLTMQAAAAELQRSPAGRVVNVASMAARKGTPGEAHYAASKAAVVALTRVAAMELGSTGVTVNAVCPGYVLTEMGAATRTEADVARWSAQSPLGRLAGVEDVAGLVAFLASDDGAYLTGQAFDISGGMVMP